MSKDFNYPFVADAIYIVVWIEIGICSVNSRKRLDAIYIVVWIEIYEELQAIKHREDAIYIVVYKKILNYNKN